MVVKEFLAGNGVELAKYQSHRKSEAQVPRRRLNKSFGGEITTPVPRTSQALRDTLRQKITNGEYLLGEIISPKCYKKLSLNPDGTLKEEYFWVSGRKIPLLDIRKRLLEQHEREGLVRDHSDEHYEGMTNEEIKNRLRELGEFEEKSGCEITRQELVKLLKHWERTRHLMIWSDHSSIMNHGHILLTVNAIYDPAFYYTSHELGGKDVQELVEKPQMYLLARCRDTIEDQLLYSDTRIEDIQQLNLEITSTHKVLIQDICRMFHGDHPSQEVESGEQIGGHYGCCGCTGSSLQFVDHVASMRAPQITLEERRKKVLEGPAGRERRNGGVNPFQQMSKEELVRECRGRHLQTDGLRKPALLSSLKEELRGVQRVPALSFPNQMASMKDLNLTRYEVVPVEPLHDLKEHINNILKELPKHLTEEEKVLFEESIEAVLSTKEKLRGSDYRLCCIVLALHLGNNCRLTIRRLLYSLAELCELLYAPADKRTPRLILRLHNVTFCHVIAFQKVFHTPEVLTYRKLYGIYFHSITCHAPLTLRLISLSSVDTEEEEREFSTINSISKATSNGHPEHIIPNCIVRAQAERKFKSGKSCFVDQQSKIGKFAGNLPDFPDTIIPNELLEKEIYQVHLENISDFLLCGKGVWWHVDEENKEIVFHDSKGKPEFQEHGPPLHHFRSHSFDSEREYLKEKWETCLALPDLHLPIRKVKVYDSHGYVSYTEHHRVFQDEPWPEEDNQPEEQSTLVLENQCMSLPLPADSSDSEEQEQQLEAWTVGLMVTPTTTNDGAELSDDDLDNDGAVIRGDDSVAVTEDLVHSPEIPKTLHLHDGNHSVESSQPQKTGNPVTEGKEHQPKAHDEILQTKLALSVSKVLGVTPLVKTLDKTRKALHDKENFKSIYYQDKYKDTLVLVQSQVLAAHNKLSKQIKEWEREFVIKHGFAPNYEHFKSKESIKSSYKKQRLSKELLKHWKITPIN